MPGSFEVGYVAEDGSAHRVALTDAWAVRFEATAPVRRFCSRKAQRHLPGHWWSATDGVHVGYESWLERADAAPGRRPARHETVASYLARLASQRGLHPDELWHQVSTPQPGTRRRAIDPGQLAAITGDRVLSLSLGHP